MADVIVVKSQTEKEHILSQLEAPEDRFRLIPTGIDPCYAHPADEHMFKTIYGVDEYILWLGMIEEQKNQLFAIEALRDITIPLVFVGAYRDRAYYDACRAAAPEHFKFLPAMPPKSEILRSTLQNCRLYLEAPLSPPGSSALEAALTGNPLVLSDGPWTTEHFQQHAIYVDPKSKDSIRKGVLDGLKNGRNTAMSEMISRRHMLPQCLEPLVRILAGLGAVR